MYTKGPWEAHKASVYFPNLQGGFDISDCPDAEANAKLISAAPDLYESLKDLIIDIGGGDKSCGHEFHCICAIDKAKAALKKAEL